MPAIKITLSRLIELFGKSVNNTELPEPIRALAARLMTLTAHVIRIDQKVDTRVKELSDQISTLTDLVQVLAQQQQGPAAAPPSSSTPPAAAPVAAPDAPSIEQEEQEEEGEDEFVARARAESAAEVAAINGSEPEPEPVPVPSIVTSIPRGKKAGGAK